MVNLINKKRNNSSLCIPRKCYSSAAILAADLEMKGSKKFDIDDIVQKCSNVIIDWNVNRVYGQNKNNCQQFIDELCKELGFDLGQFDGPFGDYLDQIRSKGSCEISFPLKGGNLIYNYSRIKRITQNK
jgi:hypothetical protein